jgi:hypothetical protein
MSQLTKSIKTRIQELTTSIEAQRTELAAYERILEIESAKVNTPVVETKSQTKPAPTPAAPPVEHSQIAFTGNKTTLVADIVKSFGSAGVSPKDVDKFFTARKIKRSKNLIYNTLSYLVSQKKLQRKDGRYFALAGGAVPQTAAAAAPKKRRLSPAGLKRIREAVKKRWAAKRAADRAAAK